MWKKQSWIIQQSCICTVNLQCSFFLCQLPENLTPPHYPGVLASPRLAVSRRHNIQQLSLVFGYRVYYHMTNRGLFATTDRRQFCFYHRHIHAGPHGEDEKINITTVQRSTMILCPCKHRRFIKAWYTDFTPGDSQFNCSTKCKLTLSIYFIFIIN